MNKDDTMSTMTLLDSPPSKNSLGRRRQALVALALASAALGSACKKTDDASAATFEQQAQAATRAATPDRKRARRAAAGRPGAALAQARLR
ncbi:hypothetical protein WME99_47710 [Sorangium sp. So ce136]|uniref:hypothetical protein n=1 Tax=Sorangium sp. So ce136 TaxID=3133284 RepID=UPI003EFD6AA1